MACFFARSLYLVTFTACLVQSVHITFPVVGAAYDYVIIGGGTAGLVVANRLSEDPDAKVLVVEYGYLETDASLSIPQQQNFWTTNAIQHDPDVSRTHYNFPIAAVKKLQNLILPIGTGSTVGGGSVINGMLFNRGSRSDYDAWEQLGNVGWGWDGLLPYFIKASNFTPPSPSEALKHGYTYDRTIWGDRGPVKSSFPAWEWPQQDYFRRAFSEMKDHNIDLLVEANDGSGTGIGWVPNTQDPTTQSRSSAKTAYYDPVADRRNLHLLTEVKAQKVTFESNIATGAELYSRHDRQRKCKRIQARREVIIAAGPVFSPHLLQLSGIGPRTILEKAKIKVVRDLPGVGMNLQDTPTIRYIYDMPKYTSPDWIAYIENETLHSDAEKIYKKNRTGPLTLCFGNTLASLSLSQISLNAAARIRNAVAREAEQLDHLPSVYTAPPRKGYVAQLKILQQQLNSSSSAVFEWPFNGWGSNFINILQKPFSRGTILLNTSDPYFSPPIVDFNTLASPIDSSLIAALVDFTRAFFKTPTLVNEFAPVPILPGPELNTSNEGQLVKELTEAQAIWPSCSHTCGGCALLPEDMGGVVNSHLLVYGVERLSVVDSSVIPILPAARLVHTVYAIAEKAADIIKTRQQRWDVMADG